jgi:hypothetical protein
MFGGKASRNASPNVATNKRRVEDLVQSGLVITTDYSGKQSPEYVLQVLERQMRTEGVQLPEALLNFHRCCDISKVCQKLAETNQVSCHIFADITDRLPEPHRAAVLAMLCKKLRGKEDFQSNDNP